MIVWFTAIGACGIYGIVDNPEILKALSPTYALAFIAGHFHIAFFALAAIVLVRHRRGGAVRGHGSLRQARDHLRLALPRAARVHAELLRPGCAGAERRVDSGGAVLSAHPGMGANPHGAVGNRGDCDRVAGGDHRRVLRGVAGGPPRLSSTVAHRAHLSIDHRPDLRAVDQRCPDGGGADPGVRVP